ncbi:MAG: flagellar basal body rod protein FlgC [Neomegalonema sp.]|nr:flagellar basal body rod protein FlgC [Neomegalonema sp.]
MQDLFKALKISSSGMAVQSERIRLVSENVANADTPGYRRKQVSFRDVIDQATGVNKVALDQISLDQSPLREEYNPSHPMANEEGIVQMSNVNMIAEMADAREANRSYAANVGLFDQSRRMYSSVLDLLRR